MKFIRILLVYLCAISTPSIAQDLINKSWIKQSIEEFVLNNDGPDTSYLRYEFKKSVVVYGFEPYAYFIEGPFKIKGNKLTLGIDEWIIETLNDSSLTIVLPGFRRMHFLAEGYLRKKQTLTQVGEYNGKPVYKTNRIITPRYKNLKSLNSVILKQERSEYNIRKAGTFLMSFIVTEDSQIANPKILKGVAPGYDEGVIKELLKTSGKWIPAYFNGKPIQSLMIYQVNFLDSL